MENERNDIKRQAGPYEEGRMEKTIDRKNGLSRDGLVGRVIVRSDSQRCATCPTEPFGCKKLVMPFGQVCVWERQEY